MFGKKIKNGKKGYLKLCLPRDSDLQQVIGDRLAVYSEQQLWCGVCCRGKGWIEGVTSWFSNGFRADQAEEAPVGDDEENKEGNEEQQVSVYMYKLQLLCIRQFVY